MRILSANIHSAAKSDRKKFTEQKEAGGGGRVTDKWSF